MMVFTTTRQKESAKATNQPSDTTLQSNLCGSRWTEEYIWWWKFWVIVAWCDYPLKYFLGRLYSVKCPPESNSPNSSQSSSNWGYSLPPPICTNFETSNINLIGQTLAMLSATDSGRHNNVWIAKRNQLIFIIVWIIMLMLQPASTQI